MSAKKKDYKHLFHNKTSEQIKPEMKEQPIEPEEALNGVETAELRIAGQPSSLTTLKSATQTMPCSPEGSWQSSRQLRSLGGEAEIEASLSDHQSTSVFSEEVLFTLQQREAISRRHHLKFITGHYGSGKVTVS